MPCTGFATSALPPSAAIVRAVRQIDLAPSGNVSNSFSATLIHETGRVFRVIGRPLFHSPHIAMLSYVTTNVKKARRTEYPRALTAFALSTGALATPSIFMADVK